MSDKKFHQPTFRLYVGHRRPLSTTEKQDLRALFEAHGRVTNTFTHHSWSNSIIAFASTREATLAKKALHGHAFKGVELGIQYARQTRCMSVRGLPQGFSLDNVKQAFRRWDLEVVERQGNTRDCVVGQEDMLVVFKRISDAGDAIATVKEMDGHTLSYDFVREDERRKREEHKERPSEQRRRSRSPAKRGNPDIRKKRSRSPARSSKHDDGFDDAWEALDEQVKSAGSKSRSIRLEGRRRSRKSRTPGIRKSRKRSRTPERRQRSDDSRKSPERRTSSRSRYRDEEDSSRSSIQLSPSRSPTPIRAAGGRSIESVKDASLGHDTKKDNDSGFQEKKEASVGEDIIQNQGKNSEQQQQQQQEVELAQEEEDHHPCPDCERLLNDLKNHTAQNHAIPITMQKGAVEVWFECHYTANSDEKAENATAVPRKTLLDEINRFLGHMGWPKWKAQSNLYKDWFIPEVLKINGPMPPREDRGPCTQEMDLPPEETRRMQEINSRGWPK